MKVGDELAFNHHKAVVKEDAKVGYFLQNTESNTRYYLSGSNKLIHPTLEDLEYAVYESQLKYLSTHKIEPHQQFYLGGIQYTVYQTPDKHYFLGESRFHNNDAIFLRLGIKDKYSWCGRFTSGSRSTGSFPECKTLNDLKCIVRALLLELKNLTSREGIDLSSSEISDKPSLLQVETEPKLIKL